MNIRYPSLARNSFFNVVYNMLNLLFPLITSMYVSRILLPEGVGRVAYAQNIVSYFVTFSALGLPTYGIREIAKARVGGSGIQLNRTFTQLMVVNFITTTISSVAFMLLLLSDSFGKDRILFLCCGLQLFFNFINIDWLYQGLENYVYIVCRSSVIKLISLIAILACVRTRDDYLIYALISSLALGGNYFFNLIHSRRYVSLDFSQFAIKKHWKPLAILGLSLFFSTIYSKLDITMLGVMYSADETGLYSNAFKLITIVTGICASISTVFLPRLSCYYQTDQIRFEQLIRSGISILSFFAFPLVTGVALLAPSAVELLYGESFLGAVSTIRILSIIVIIKAFGDLLCYQLCIATGHERERLLAYALAALANVILNYLLIPVLGRNGAAIASVVSELLLNTVQFIKLKKIIGYKIPAKSVLEGIISSVLMGGMIILAFPNTAPVFVQCLVGFSTGCVVYFSVNAVMHNEIMENALNFLRSKGGKQDF